jgi:hypothetical protein
VAAFATALVNTPDQLPENLLGRVAHKHASLAIAPELTELGGAAESHEVADEDLDEAHAATAANSS